MKLSTIIDYIKTSPYNTNPVILQQLLQDYIDHPEPTPPTPPTPGDLTPFAVGQTITGIAVDTNGLSNSEIDSWLDSFDFTSEDTYQLIEPLGDSSGMMVGGGAAAPYPTLIIMGQVPVYYAREQYEVEGETIPKGWSYMDDDQKIAVPFSGQREVTFASGAELTITNVNNHLSALNGIVLGAIVGEPAGGLTPFAVGDDFDRIQCATNLSNDEINTIIQSVLGNEQLVTVLSTRYDEMDHEILHFAQNEGVYGISLIDGVPIYISQDSEGLTAGWQSSIKIDDETTLNLVDSNGVLNFYAICQQIGGSGVDLWRNINDIQSGSNWNGILFGKAN